MTLSTGTGQALKVSALKPAKALIFVTIGLAGASFLWNAWFYLAGRYLWTSPGLSPLVPLDHLSQVASIEATPGELPAIVDLGLGVRMLALSPALVGTAAAVAALLILMGILRGIVAEPFTAEVVAAWRRLGWTLLGAVMAVAALDAVAIGVISSSYPRGEGLLVLNMAGPHVSIELAVVGAACLVTAHAFKKGHEYRQDLNGLV